MLQIITELENFYNKQSVIIKNGMFNLAKLLTLKQESNDGVKKITLGYIDGAPVFHSMDNEILVDIVYGDNNNWVYDFKLNPKSDYYDYYLQAVKTFVPSDNIENTTILKCSCVSDNFNIEFCKPSSKGGYDFFLPTLYQFFIDMDEKQTLNKVTPDKEDDIDFNSINLLFMLMISVGDLLDLDFT